MRHALRAVLIALLIWGQITPAFAASRFWVGGTGTWDNVATTNWSATTGGAGGQSPPTIADNCTFDGASGGGTVTVNAAVQCTAATMGAFTGTIDFATNNNSPTFNFFSCTGAGARTLNMGSGTWTINGTSGSVWDCGTVTNFTLNANTSTVLVAATATGTRNIVLGGKTFNNITISNPTQSAFLIDMQTGAATIAGLTVTNAMNWRLPQSTTLTISSTLTYNNGGGPLLGMVYTGGIAATLSVAAATVFDNAVMQNVTKAGAGSIAVTNGYAGGGNTGVAVTGPSTGGARCIGC